MNTVHSLRKIALVSGANKGIGFEICRQLARKNFHVILTSRDPVKGKDACAKLQKDGGSVQYAQLDVSSLESILNLKRWMETNFAEGLDVLINNAAIFLPPDRAQNSSILTLEAGTLNTTLSSNLYGPIFLSQALVPFLIRKKGKIIRSGFISHCK